MKKTFEATVVSVVPTDTGSHSVEFSIRGGRVELPMFSAAEARDLAAMYQSAGAVKITFQAGEPEGNGEPEFTGSDRFAESQREALRLAIMKTVKMLRDAVNGQLPSVNTCYSTYKELDAAAAAVFGATDGPPIVNEKPSCCEAAKGSPLRIVDPRVREYGAPKMKAWALGAHFSIEHCPYCGTKLPALDGAPS